MVGIVIVSHSNKVAEGIRELSLQMSSKDLRIIAVGGLSDGSIGTDAVMISEAILKANTGDGVAVLFDLGSALFSTYTAYEFLDESTRKLVKIADAPILEGSIVAAIHASAESNLDSVVAAAEETRGIHKL
jgi:phosphoenolpyruvate---glycerone phosphotransferase subunit DhaM